MVTAKWLNWRFSQNFQQQFELNVFSEIPPLVIVVALKL